MIVGSVLLVIVAGVLLGLGLVLLEEPLLYSSIGVSGLAALTLVVGIRRLAAARAGRLASASAGAIAVRRLAAQGRATPRPVGRASPRPIGRAVVNPPVDGVAPADLDALAEADPAVPADEPSAEPVTEAELALIGQLAAQVVVVDGRPRFHLADCLHLLGLDSETVTAAAAVEFGFTPCAACQPVTALRLLAVDDDAALSSD